MIVIQFAVILLYSEGDIFEKATVLPQFIHIISRVTNTTIKNGGDLMAVAHKGSISMGLVLIPVGFYKTNVDNDIHGWYFLKDWESQWKKRNSCKLHRSP